MTQEEKELLLKELSARLCYGIICAIGLKPHKLKGINKHKKLWWFEFDGFRCLDGVKPYLRPMSSMTEEEKEELLNILPKYWSLEIDKLGDLYFDICDASYPDIELLTDIIYWLNRHHFDYRGLIEKGLALEAPEGMYK